jgi:hypothetical protein|tara:strand:- start:282 stop:473 length:192 start_codon:yes stop_codon:yes gene_type:complete
MKILSTLIMIMAWFVCIALSFAMNEVFSHEVYDHAQNFVYFVKSLPILAALASTGMWLTLLTK